MIDLVYVFDYLVVNPSISCRISDSYSVFRHSSLLTNPVHQFYPIYQYKSQYKINQSLLSWLLPTSSIFHSHQCNRADRPDGEA